MHTHFGRVFIVFKSYKTTLNYYKNLYEKCIYDWHSLLVLRSRISSSKSHYRICLHTLLIIVYIQSYLILIHRVQSCTLHIVSPSSKQVLQPTNVRLSMIINFFFPLQHSSSNILSIFLHAYI